MLKRNLLIVLSLVMIGQVYSQCVPVSFSGQGIYPDTITNLPLAVATVPYNEAMTAIVPLDTVVSGILITVDSLGITEIIGLPSGFAYIPNTATGYWHGGVTGCIAITGNPLQSQVGVYPLKLIINMSVLSTQMTDTAYGYRIEILNSSFANCFDTVPGIAIDTCFSFTPDTASIYSYNLSGNDSVSVVWLVSDQNYTHHGFLTAMYPVNSNTCYLMGITIQCNKSVIYQFYDRIYIDNIATKIKQVNEADIGLDIFPNPATNDITINYPVKAEIDIMNIEGQNIKTIFNNCKMTTIDIGDLSNGVYVIKAKTNKEVAIKRFIKE